MISVLIFFLLLVNIVETVTRTKLDSNYWQIEGVAPVGPETIVPRSGSKCATHYLSR